MCLVLCELEMFSVMVIAFYYQIHSNIISYVNFFRFLTHSHTGEVINIIHIKTANREYSSKVEWVRGNCDCS